MHFIQPSRSLSFHPTCYDLSSFFTYVCESLLPYGACTSSLVLELYRLLYFIASLPLLLYLEQAFVHLERFLQIR